MTDVLFYHYFGILLNAQTFFLLFGLPLVVGAIFTSFTFLFETTGKGFVSFIVLPLAILFFFYYVFSLLIDGFFKFKEVSIYVIYLNPFHIGPEILSTLDRGLGMGSGTPQIYNPFSIQDVIVSLSIWAIIPIIVAIVIWRKLDI